MTNTNIDETSPLIFRSTSIINKTDERTDLERKISVWLILLSAGFERLAFYSLAGNLVLFLISDNIQWSSTNSVTVSFIFLGTSYVSALFFAWLSDGKFGRAKTIIIGFILYIIGYVFISLFSDHNKFELYNTLCLSPNSSNSITHEFFNELCLPQILSALILTGIGAGAVQANMAIFGADQVHEQKLTRKYFDKYYAAVNTGGLVAFGFIAYAQQNDSYFIGYTVPAGLLIIAFILFLIGYKFYIHIQPIDSVIGNFIPVIRNAIHTRRKYRQNKKVTNTNRKSSDTSRLLDDQNDDQDRLLSSSINTSSWSFLDYAKISNQGQYLDRLVDDIKSLRQIIIVFILLIPYWLVYIQIETTFLIQGVHMKVIEFYSIHNKKHYMPIIWLSLGDQLIIIFIIFILNTFVYKRLEVSGRSFSIRSRIIIGMISATLAMCIAGTVEIFRQDICDKTNVIQTIGNSNYTAADMSIFYQFPQYMSIGLSEVFTSVASLEFAYLAAPRSAQSLIMSLRFCSAGFSSFIGAFYIRIFVTIRENLTFENYQCKAETYPELFYIYFFVLAGFQFIFILIFLGCDRKFKLLYVTKRRLNTCLFVGSNSRSTT